jgi:hypothetical protein
MAAADGPVPVRTLAQAARLCREARHLHQYGIEMSDTSLGLNRAGRRLPARRAAADGHPQPEPAELAPRRWRPRTCSRPWGWR